MIHLYKVPYSFHYFLDFILIHAIPFVIQLIMITFSQYDVDDVMLTQLMISSSLIQFDN